MDPPRINPTLGPLLTGALGVSILAMLGLAAYSLATGFVSVYFGPVLIAVAVADAAILLLVLAPIFTVQLAQDGVSAGVSGLKRTILWRGAEARKRTVSSRSGPSIIYTVRSGRTRIGLPRGMFLEPEALDAYMENRFPGISQTGAGWRPGR